MNIQQITNAQNFEGKLIILNDLSQKPYASINKVKDNLQKQIQPKKYDLYIGQDYSANKIRIAASHFRPSYIKGALAHEELPITAKSSRYLYAAKDAIDKHEKALSETEQEKWEQRIKERKREELLDFAQTLLYAPFYIVEYILRDINPKWAKKFEKFIDKIEI